MAENQFPENETQSDASPLDDVIVAEEVEASPQRESLSRGGLFAWITIFVVMTAMISLTAFSRSAEETRTEATSSDLFPVQLQARTLVGQKSFLGSMGAVGEPAESEPSEDDQAEAEADAETEGKKKDAKPNVGPPVPAALNDGTYEQRLCYVLLVNENNGPTEAGRKLVKLDEAAEKAGFEMSEKQARLREIVGMLLGSHEQGDFDAKPLVDEERELLKSELGWIGELALVPQGTRNKETRKELLSDASWSMGLMMAAMGFGALMLLSGIAIAAVFSVLFATGKLTPKFLTRGKSINIYIETFALWMVFFFFGPQLTAFLVRLTGVEMSTTVDMSISIGFFFGSLIVLVYPMLRGISFRQLCDDIGWKAKGSLVDMLVSPINYVAGTPLMLGGLFCVLLLTLVGSLFTPEKPFGTGVAAGHPIQDIIANGEWLSIAYVVLMACVAAPIVEETMFRGVLYRHLRELSGGWARWGSVIFSSVFNGLIFAAIHPQGFVAIPLLTALAINFSLAREWRDSLVAPIIMHAINNGAVTTFMLLMMS